MLKTVSSITNALGSLNYKGTWNASTNIPTLASGTGTKGDYYVVSVAGTTALDGISNWGVGDWATYNGTVWQRVEGGADLNGVNLNVTGTSTLAAVTASTINLLTVGQGAGSVATNTALGTTALNANTSGGNNTSAGHQSGFRNTTGAQNSYFGATSGYSNLTSNANAGFGFGALFSNTAQNNAAFGFGAMYSNTTGANNTAVGGGAFGFAYGALSSNTSGSNNTAVGNLASVNTTTGSNNTSVGMEALKNNSTSSNNTALGYQAGIGITTGSNLTVIGSMAAASTAIATNEMTFGNSSVTVWRYPGSTTVGGLPSATTVGRGSRSFVTDALAPAFGTTVAAGGAVFTPVYSNGTNWIVG